MQRSCLLSSPSIPLFPNRTAVVLPLRNRLRSSSASNYCTNIPFSFSISSRFILPPLHSTAVEENVETVIDGTEFVEVGYICKVHGLQGELRVKPNTDFPELRFATPGRRWLKEKHLGKEIIREIELVEGRDHPGQKSWIVSFSGIDTVDKAKQLIGSSLLVRESERPELEEGEFYTRDLVGMKVILKDTGEPVGTVVNVFNSGGPNDLLQVRLNSNEEMREGTGSSESETGTSGHLAWVPFVEAIVPDVDMNKREMTITPPKGLLELNRRSDVRSKKERRQLEWKERKRASRLLIAAKKKLGEMEQKHIFHGLRFGEKAQRASLADHIVGINFKLFQQALQSFETVSSRWNLPEFVSSYSTKLLEDPIKISEECLVSSATDDKMGTNGVLRKKGLNIISEGKAAVVLALDGQKNLGGCDNIEHDDLGSTVSSNISSLQALFQDGNSFTKMEGDRGILPLVVVSSAHETKSLQSTFSDHEYFDFDADKVWFLEEESLPVVSSSVDEESRHKVLMKSPWEILQSPVGSGGIFNLLASHKILENLSELGVEYVQVCSLSERLLVGNPTFFGLVSSQKADIGIKMCKYDDAEDFNVIFSMKILKKIINQIDKCKFHAIPRQNSHVEFEMVDKEWVDVVPSSPNSYELHCSIYSSLDVCSPDRICIMEVSD